LTAAFGVLLLPDFLQLSHVLPPLLGKIHEPIPTWIFREGVLVDIGSHLGHNDTTLFVGETVITAKLHTIDRCSPRLTLPSFEFVVPEKLEGTA
jgi:hypothetical protein